MWNNLRRGILLAGAVFSSACSSSAIAPATADLPVVLGVTPAANATSVDPSAPITIAFNRPMRAGMEMLIMLHDGTAVGPQVPGNASWSTDRTVLTFVPAAALRSKATYVLHLSPNLKDALGRGIDFVACANRVGGRPFSRGMIGGGMMGPGWQPGTGTWGQGMTFTFTTA